MLRGTLAVALLATLCVACGPSGGGGDASVSGDATLLDDGGQQDAHVSPDVLVWDAYVPVCGNGTLDDEEVCDDGNLVNGDGCNASCTKADGSDDVAAAFLDGDQLAPRVAVAGDFLVATWEDWGLSEADGSSARVRAFGSDGVEISLPAVGSAVDFAADTTTAGDQYEVAAAGHSDGRFVVVWTDTSGAAGGGTDVRAAFFDADGNRISNAQTGTDDFVVHSTTTGTQQQPAVGISDQGLILIAWSDDSALGGDTSGWAVRGRLFDFAGVPQTNLETGGSDDFLINESSSGSQYRPSLVPNSSLGWAVVWVDDTNLDPSGTGIVGTILGPYGDHSLPSEVLVNSTTDGAQTDPAIAVQPSIGYVVVWTDDSRGADDPYFRAIRGRVFDLAFSPRSNGVTMTAEDFPINTLTDGSQQHPAVAADPSTGDVVVVWQDGSASDGSWAGIRGRAFSVSLSPLANDLAADGGDFKINTTTSQAQLTPTVALLAGQAFCAWEDQSGAAPDASGTAIRYRILPPLW